jgi:hypothetical protein
MHMNGKIKAGRHVASRLFSTEKAIDEALAAAASLQIALIEARQETLQACGTIQKYLDDAVAASAALMEARRAIVGAHDKLEKLRDDLGVPATAVGCTPKLRASLAGEAAVEAEETQQLKAV